MHGRQKQTEKSSFSELLENFAENCRLFDRGRGCLGMAGAPEHGNGPSALRRGLDSPSAAAEE
jgi:hypothetical protein